MRHKERDGELERRIKREMEKKSYWKIERESWTIGERE
jgi:hypothetical protein